MINDIEEHLRSPNSTKISKKGKIKGKAEWIHIVESRAFNSTTGGPANRSIADEVQGILTIQMDVWLNPKDLALSGVDVNRIWRLGPFLNMPRPHPDGVHRQFGVYGKDCLNTSVGGLTGAQSLWEDLDWNWGLDSKHKGAKTQKELSAAFDPSNAAAVAGTLLGDAVPIAEFDYSHAGLKKQGAHLTPAKARAMGQMLCAGWQELFYVPKHMWPAFRIMTEHHFRAGVYFEVGIYTVLNNLEVMFEQPAQVLECWGCSQSQVRHPKVIQAFGCGHRADFAEQHVRDVFQRILDEDTPLSWATVEERSKKGSIWTRRLNESSGTIHKDKWHSLSFNYQESLTTRLKALDFTFNAWTEERGAYWESKKAVKEMKLSFWTGGCCTLSHDEAVGCKCISRVTPPTVNKERVAMTSDCFNLSRAPYERLRVVDSTRYLTWLGRDASSDPAPQKKKLPFAWPWGK